MLFRKLQKLLVLLICLFLTGFAYSQSLSISLENADNGYKPGDQLNVNLQLDNFIPDNPSFLHSWIDETGYRKLKLGNNPDNYYNPPLDVIAGGNNEVQICMRVKDDATVWSKMLFRPNGVANSVILSNHIPESIEVNKWFTINVPLNVFEELTDLTQLRNLEFPYSAGANHYNWDIYSIIFSGGSSPVIWLGSGNINNANNGNGGPGEVFAEWSISSATDLEIPSIKLYANNALIGSKEGLNTDFIFTAESAGSMNILAEAWSGTELVASASMQINIEDNTDPDIGILLTSPGDNDQFEYQEVINVLTEITGDLTTDLPYLKVNGLPEGWRKLKIGNNSSNLYGPAIDAVSSGNNHIELILKDNTSVDWSKIELRPNGNGTNPIGIEYYWNQKQELDNGWYKIEIPLNVFDSSIDFTALKNLEFPYSKSAGEFELLIQEIKFTGGSEEYLWFGEEKSDNIHDGFGNPGQLIAETIHPDNGGYNEIRADLFIDQTLHSSDHLLPFSYSLLDLTPGTHTIQIILNLDQEQISSNSASILVLDPVNNLPEIELDPFYPFGVILANKSFSISGQIVNIDTDITYTTVLEIDGTTIGSTDQVNFTFLAKFSTPGAHEWSVKTSTNTGTEMSSDPYNIEVIDPQISSNLNLASPSENQILIQNTSFNVQASFTPEETGDLPYMEISNPGSGYRKLKIGNNPLNLYSPQVNLTESGNSQLELTLNLLDGEPDLSKIVICPQEFTTNAPKLSDYWDQAQDLGNGWKKIRVPLSDFDRSIDFSSLGYIAFPYSRDAGYFKIGLRTIEFTGGTSPYLYFGDTKLDNLHDGFGNAGQLLASIIEAGQSAQPEQFVFFLDNLFLGYVDNQETPLTNIASELGTHTIDVMGIMINDLHIQGVKSEFSIIEPIPESESIVLKLSFDNQDAISITKAKLRYNKKFAYSLTLDDGLDDAYTNALKILQGGYVEGNGQTYPGLFTTDGCGNDIPFTGGLAWYSVNSSMIDLHINTPGYIKWDELIQMYNAGWDVLNHSYSHSTDATTDHYFQIDENQKIVYEKTGINMTQFVIPGGAVYLPYIPVAQNYGMHALYANKSDFTGFPSRIQVDNISSWENMTIYRNFKYDDSYNTTNISDQIDEIANNSAQDNHVWFNDFTHRIQFGETGGSLQFDTFEFYMQHIADQYGKNGDDNVWMAPIQQVWEYLFIRDHVNIVTAWQGNDLMVTIDISQLPGDLRTKAITLLASGSSDYTIVVETPGVTISSNPDSGLINLQWNIEEPKQKAFEIAVQEEETLEEISCYPNPVSEYLNIKLTDIEKNSSLRIYDIKGKEYYCKEIHTSNKLLVLNRAELQLETGIYFIQLTESDKTMTKKILVK